MNSWKLCKLFAVTLLLVGCISNGYAAQEPVPTTTPTPPSTTTASTTTASTSTTTSTTTPTSTTTTTPLPTTTTQAPAPKPIPAPSIGKWNTSCTMIQMAAQVNLTYETKDNKSASAIYNLPSNATVSDHQCQNQTEQMSLIWGPDGAIHSLAIMFNKNDTKQEFELSSLIFSIPIEGDNFPNAKDNQHAQLIFTGKKFSTPIHMSYHCTREQLLNLTETLDENAEPMGWVALTNVQFEAFRPENKTSFSTAKDCDAIDTPDVVPIAVGIALATLIVIVLIAYLIARRRSTARGYTSF